MNLLLNILEIRECFRPTIMRSTTTSNGLNPLRITGEKGKNKALLYPDARENLGFSVQTIIASWTKFAKMQILLYSDETVFRYFLVRLTNQGAFQTETQRHMVVTVMVLISYESGVRRGKIKHCFIPTQEKI